MNLANSAEVFSRNDSGIRVLVDIKVLWRF